MSVSKLGGGMDSQAIASVQKFYDENCRELHTYAVSLLRDREAAEDIVHSAFEKLLRRLFPPRELRPYVYRAVRNGAWDLLRRNHRFPGAASVYADVPAVHPAEELALREEAGRLLALLSDDERECVVLKLFNSLTFQEIAVIRRVSINTAASWYRRAMEKMKAQATERDK